MRYAFYETNFNDLTVKLVCICFEIAYAKNRKKQTFRDQVTGQNVLTVINKKSRFNVILTPILMIFYRYTPWPYMNTMNEFNLQFKIFTQVDTTKSYVILDESINKLLVLVNLSFWWDTHSKKLISTIQLSNLFVYFLRSHTPKIIKKKYSEIK